VPQPVIDFRPPKSFVNIQPSNCLFRTEMAWELCEARAIQPAREIPQQALFIG